MRTYRNQQQQTGGMVTAMRHAARAIDHEDRALVQDIAGAYSGTQWQGAADQWAAAAASIRNASGPATVARDYATRARQATRHAEASAAALAAVEVTR
jgi:hypothetical protein